MSEQIKNTAVIHVDSRKVLVSYQHHGDKTTVKLICDAGASSAGHSGHFIRKAWNFGTGRYTMLTKFFNLRLAQE